MIFMGISPEKSNSSVRNAATVAYQLSFSRILHRKIFSCGAPTLFLLANLVGSCVTVSAQEERPQITPGERKVPRKKDADPRALAVLQLTANGKASLVPLAILVNGKFWDASAYKADPVPMALEPGTVYEAERTGNSVGLFTVTSALHSNAINVQAPWIGTGAWHPTGTEGVTTTEKKAESVPVGIDTTDEPPRLTHDPTAKPNPPANTPASTSPASSIPSPSSGQPDTGDEPPRLTKPASAPAGSAQSTPAPQAAGDSKPKDTEAAGAKPDQQANVPASDSGATEGNRPRLRRGKPAESFADEEVPGYSKPGAPLRIPADAAKIIEAPAAQGPVQLIPAISDANGPELRSFVFDWLKEEEGDRRKQMMGLAKDQLHAYLAAQAKARITPKPEHPSAARHAPAAKLQEPIFENVQMIAYDLWKNGQAVIVFSADAHMPPPPVGTAHSEVDTEMRYSIVLVAYPDMYNNLHKLYVGVTDKYHLDVTPRLELIDAVDADGDRRGELLFRKVTDAGTGWVLYRATADKLWVLFDSLSPE